MSNADRLENSNRIEYNTCDSEEDNYYKKSYSNNMYHKTYNNFYRKNKIKIIKNKTPKNFFKIKYPSLSKSLKEKKDSVFTPSYSLIDNEQNNKDTLFLEVIKSQKNIQNINSKLKDLKSDIKILEQGNLTNMYIIENILELKDNNDNEDDEELNYINNKKKNNNNNAKRKKNIIRNEENNKINVLKKQINSYDLTIKKTGIKLDELKSRSKQKRYQEVIILLYNKEKEINQISEKFREINNILIENDTKINFYNLRIQQYNNDISKLERKLRYNNELIYEN